MELKEYIEELQLRIQATYEEDVTIGRAEKLASELLSAQLIISKELAALDLDARMRKSGVKAIRGAVYLEEARRGDKKPSDTMLTAFVDTSDLVTGEQKRLDEAEVKKAELERIFDILTNGHIHYRTIAKGSFSL